MMKTIISRFDKREELIALLEVNPGLVIIKLGATWCGPCKMMKPILEELKTKVGDQIKILKIDVDKNQQVASAYKIQGVPTLMLFKSGQIKWRQSGVLSAKDLLKVLEQYAK